MLSYRNFVFACILLVLSAVFSAASRPASRRRQLGRDFYPACNSVTSLGYPCEDHPIRTADNWVLGAIRIPPKVRGAYPVFLQHGLIDCSATWTFNALPSQNLATILHDAGFDVWLGNSRGNHFSQFCYGHPNQDSAEYFFMTDMDSMASCDVPANIGYVLNATGRSSLAFVGHSQGTWQMFSHFSTDKRFVNNVDVFIALAPVTRVVHTTSLLLKFLAGLDTASWLALFGDKWFLTNDELLRLAGKICPETGPLCADLLMPLVGNFNPSAINESQLYNYLKYGPGGTSVTNMRHWQQAVKNVDGGYAMHDYGPELNTKYYHSPIAPTYELSNFTGPKTVIVAGTDDALADPQDVQGLISRIQPGGALVYSEFIPGIAHMDFVWSNTAYQYLYPKIVSWVKQYMKK